MTDLRGSDELSTGDLLVGRYRLEQRIGQGAMARVYRAEDLALGRTVAVKVLTGPLDEIGSVERARSETTLLASLNHHALVTLFDASISADEPSYLVMEHVAGITLRDLIARGPLEPAVAAAIAVDLAEGLHVAHTAGIVHRDIKPANVLLSQSSVPRTQWRAKLADFGIAYLLDSTRVTTPGIMVGTVAYVAPEQARGEAPAPPADIYAFGILLIEALTGTRPFGDAEGIGIITARLSRSPEIPEDIAPEWQQLLRRMTAMQPDDRPTALEIAGAAARLAGVDASTLDEPTVALAEPILAPADSTQPTAILPAAAAVPALMASPPVASAAAARGTRSGATAAPAPHRARLLIGAAIAGVMVLALLVSMWSGMFAAAPTPEPSEPAVVEPSIEPTPEQDAPVEEEDTDTEPVTDTEPETDPAPGPGNENSGPGNNNGNSGPGKEKAKEEKEKEKGKGP